MDVRALVSALLACVALTVAGLVSSPPSLSLREPLSASLAPWCLPDQTPSFSFGFADLASELGPVVGKPVECEHGAPASSDTLQRTTTGLLLYQWCVNASTFTLGDDHWTMLESGTVVHWTASDRPPKAPVVRAPDLRNPCPPE